MNPTKKYMYECGDTKWQWSEKAEQGQYKIYPSESSPGEYILKRKGDAKEVWFHFFRKTEVERSGMQEPEVGEEVECLAWRRRRKTIP